MKRLFKDSKSAVTVVVLGLCIMLSGFLAAYVTTNMLSYASTGGAKSYAKELNKDDPANYISKERAKAIAIQDAGLDKSKVTVSRIELDWDDFKPNYDIEIWFEGVEYEYEIDAKNGGVLEKSKEKYFDYSKEPVPYEREGSGNSSGGNGGTGGTRNTGNGSGNYGNGYYDDDYYDDDDRYDRYDDDYYDDDDDDDYDDDYDDDDRYDEDRYDDYDDEDDD